ncbi:MAG: LysM peptidoglycan-binding domain-containing protein [Candidatus Gracilibacteria bacterium]
MGKNKKTKINIKARLNRHLRIVKENIGTNNDDESTMMSNHHYGIVLFFILLIVPIYPTLASVIYNTSRYDFYRGDIDESSIIESYFGSEETDDEFNNPIFESTDSFISVNTILNDERDLEGTNEIVEYEVNPGDSFYSISYKFAVSTNSIYWANDFSKNHTLQPGEVIKVPPVTGLIHQVKSGDTISTIAMKYDIEEEKIKEQNGLGSDGKLITGEVLVIPGAIKIIPKPVYKAPVITKTTTKKTTTTGYSFAGQSSSEYVSKTDRYKLVRRAPQHTFYWGNCTRYVGQYKNVNWGGNANAWIKNAKAKGHSTGTNPTLGAIVQFTGRGYNPRYGHVGIVMDITSTDIIVSDMNYRRLNEVTYRKVPINDRSIDGYIYVN